MLKRLIKKVSGLFADRQRKAARRKNARTVISQSKLFDAQWYVDTYPDVAAAKLDPLDHFVIHGAAEGRNPSNRFDLRWYTKRNPDVARSGINPLLHYLQYGRDEGRSIRPVNPTIIGNGAFEGDQRKKAKGQKGKPKAPAYPSDFKTRWQARPVSWKAVPSAPKPAVPQSLPDHSIDPNGNVDWLAEILRTTGPETAEGGRPHLFRAMQPDSLTEQNEPAIHAGDMQLVDSQAAQHLLKFHGLGLDTIVDGWFAGTGQLILRIGNLGHGTTIIRAFQFNSASQMICCGETEITSPQFQLLSLHLEEELGPLLLTGHTADGALAFSALIPFPSLFRGGLHHCEFEARQILSPDSISLADYMSALASSLYFQPDLASPCAIGQIEVDLQGANGSERLCNPETAATLARQFGLRCEFRAPDGSETLQQLAARLERNFRSPRVSARRSAGRTLVLPADALPTLCGLAARAGDPDLGLSSFCIVEAGIAQPYALVCHPPASRTLHHPALPLPGPVFKDIGLHDGELGPTMGAPVMIRFRDGKIWNVDQLMPVSPDIAMPSMGEQVGPDGTQGKTPSISVVLDRPAQDDLLSLCLASLSRQTIAADLEIILTGPAIRPAGMPAFPAQERLIECPTTDLPRIESLDRAASLATAEHLLFLDGSLCLPDPRTLALLLEITRQPNIGSVSCAIVREDSVDGSVSIECAGFFGRYRADRKAWDIVETPADVARLFPATTYPVVANTMRLCLMPAGVWRRLREEKAIDFSGSDEGLVLGLRASTAGLAHHCTTLTSAAVAGPAEPSQQDWRPKPAPAVLRTISEAPFPPVADIRRLRR